MKYGEMALKMLFLLIFLTHLSTHLFASELEMPPMPNYDWGACPFEGCSYGEWEVCATTPVRKNHDKNAPIVSKIKKGEIIRAVTGVVVTTQPGIVKVLKSVTLDEEHPVSLNPGDVFYRLHYQGEDFDLFWYKGAIHSAQMEYHNQIPGAVKDTFQLEGEPKSDWWIQINTSAGNVGWSNEPGHFGNIGGCI